MMTERAKDLDLRKLGQHISSALGEGWKLLPGGEGEQEMSGFQLWYIHLQAPEGQEIGVRLDRRKGRLEIRPSFPRRSDSGYADWGPSSRDTRPEMGCDAFKAPDIIASDIKRRFLPVYLEQHKRALEMKATVETAGAKRLELVNKLVQALGDKGKLRNGRNHSDQLEASFNSLSPLYGELVASHDSKHVDLKVSNVPAFVALKIAALLAKVEEKDDE